LEKERLQELQRIAGSLEMMNNSSHGISSSSAQEYTTQDYSYLYAHLK
jgi:hypothetical protein